VAALADRQGDTRDGDIVEVCPSTAAIAAALGARIAAQRGAAVIVDYGGWRSRGDTLQAVRGHAFADPLAEPGEADLTAHVDFAALAAAARPAAATRMIAQGTLLDRLGIAGRTARLAAGLTGAALDNHLAAHRRLTDPDQMGTVFQALALYPQGGPVPPGFDP
jgi:SAM-dependent MidA family methyltransferase